MEDIKDKYVGIYIWKRNIDFKIPKIFHRIWIGDNPMPKDFIEYGKSWQKYHPSWEMKLWTEDNLFELENQRMYDRARTLSEKSDIIRMELLKRFGGVYVDCDFECYKSIEPLIKDSNFFVCTDLDHWYFTDSPYLNGALMGCTKNHSIIEMMVDELPKFIRKYKDKLIYSDLIENEKISQIALNRIYGSLSNNHYAYKFI